MTRAFGVAGRGSFERTVAGWCRPDADPEALAAVLNRWNLADDPMRGLSSIRAEGVAPLCGYQIKRHHLDGDIAGERVTRGLVADYHRNTAKNLWRLTGLRPVLAAFDRGQVPALLLKGAALAVSVYPEIGLRTMSDVDVLIRPESLPSADALLREAGYRAIDLAGLDLAHPPLEHLTTLDYRDPGREKPAIHLHWHLINSTVPHTDYSGRIDVNGIWARAARVSLEGLPVLAPSPCDAVLSLSEHAMRVSHSLSRLVWLADLAWLINRADDQLNWTEVSERARQWGIERLVRPVLLVVREWFGAPIPDDFMHSIRSTGESWEERLFSACLARSIRRPGLSYLIHLAMRRGASAKMRFIVSTISPPRMVLTRHCSIRPHEPLRCSPLSRVREMVGSVARLIVSPLLDRYF
jgi:hypothetical protein